MRKTAFSASVISCSFSLAIFREASSSRSRFLSSLILVSASLISLESVLCFLSLIKSLIFPIIKAKLESTRTSSYKSSTSLSRTVLCSSEAESLFSFSIIFSSAMTSPSSLPSSLIRSSLCFLATLKPDSNSITFFTFFDSLESFSRASLNGFLS